MKDIMEANNTQSVFSILNKINCNEHTEKKGCLTYLSWAWAWGIVKTHFPDATYTIYENERGIPYFTDGRTCWVKTGVTINGIEHIEYLPIKDYSNRSIPLERVTSMDMNTAIQRSLTKACARQGLGLYIYAGEDLPDSYEAEVTPDCFAPTPGYKPLDDATYWAIIKNYCIGVPAKDGSDYRTAWARMTGAGKSELLMFDAHVQDYKKINNL